MLNIKTPLHLLQQVMLHPLCGTFSPHKRQLKQELYNDRARDGEAKDMKTCLGTRLKIEQNKNLMYLTQKQSKNLN